MDPEYAFSRKTTEGFARRVRKNLQFVIVKRSEGEDVHEVTQLVTSLLGLIVFPWEAGALRSLEQLSLGELEQQGWPRWKITLDEKGDTKTLGKLVEHLRNAAAHRRLAFSADHPEMAMVDITFEDAPSKSKPVNWRVVVNSADLKEFCDRFTNRLEDAAG
jgi:hypothetical protein